MVDILNDQEHKIINALINNTRSTQRDISRSSGLSLGLTNIIIKRLIKKGFLKIKKLNRKKILYHLTPQAMLQKSIRTYNYIERSIKDVMEIKKKIQVSVLKNLNSKHRSVFIVGDNEIAEIAKWALSELKLENIKIYYKKDNHTKQDSFALIINCENKNIKKKNYVNIFEML
ncbi:MAG: winged helix-turn-helix transcriptional regulator [Spirochaetes bacterium]|nr:winged helix-turn-helix transcriptional regulator [Spirochaetota bacterium]